jgi:hypothetical protein
MAMFNLTPNQEVVTMFFGGILLVVGGAFLRRLWVKR